MYWRNRSDVSARTRRAPTDPGGCRRSFAMAVLVAWIASGPVASAQEVGNVPAASVPDAAARQIAAQMADLGTPAFVDGLAGLLVLHAGRDREIAGAIGHRVMTRAPAAGGQVARALRLAGFDPAVAGLDGGPADPDTAAAAPAAPVVSGPGGRLARSPGASWGQQTVRPGPGDLGTPQLR